MRSRRSNGYRADISIFSTIICSAIAASRRRSSTACAEWVACGRRQAPSTPCLRPTCSRRPLNPDYEVSSSGSKRSTRRISLSSGSIRTCGATTPAAIRRLHDLGVMINGSFVFGMDGDDGSVFERTVEWAIEQRNRDSDVSHPDALSGHRAVSPLRGSGPAHAQQLGSLRHAAHGVSSGAADGRAARTGVSVGVQALLHVAIDRARRRGARRSRRRATPLRLCGRMEEVRTAVGFRDSREARRDDAARARVDPQRVRPTIGELDQCRGVRPMQRTGSKAPLPVGPSVGPLLQIQR